jgi:hypothetical protein
MKSQTMNIISKAVIAISRSEGEGDPLNGDDVEEISLRFVALLCIQNGEHDQLSQILNRKHKDKIIKIWHDNTD